MTDAGAPVQRAAITNLGCKVNQSEMDAIERLLRARGVEVVADGSAVDLHVVNTCTVTAVADDKSRKAVRRARRASPGARVVVTGCSVQVGPGAFAALDPDARLIANDAKDELLAEIERLLGPAVRTGGPAERGRRTTHRPLDAALPTLAGVEVAGLDGVADGRGRIDRTRAFVKVQDGCSFHCTYCIIPRARGPERSLAPEVVLADVNRALAAGHREVVLTGINIGTYDGGSSEPGPRGSHARAALTLAGLVRRILAETPVERIRLSSIEPQHVDDDLLEVWTGAGAGRCLPHFHLPLQSGDDGVLRRMGRRYDADAYARVVALVRAAIPGAATHADVIAGFPTEDGAAFERSMAFIRSLDLAGLHVFRYSARPGTPSTRMAGQVPEAARRERAAALLGEAAACRQRWARRAVGGLRIVLFEEPATGEGSSASTRSAPAKEPAAGGYHPAGWVGHAEDYVLVRAALADDRPLEGEIAVVAIDGIDPLDPDRVVGRIERPVGRPAAGTARSGDRDGTPGRRSAAISFERPATPVAAGRVAAGSVAASGGARR